MRTRKVSWEWKGPVREADALTTFMCRISWKSGSLNLLEPLWATPDLLRDCFTFTFCLLTYLLTYFLTYLLTPCSRVLLEKLTGSAASQEIPRIFGTRMFIIVPTSARHLSLSWANSIQSPQPPPTSWTTVLILSSHLRLGLPNGLFPSGFPTKTYLFTIAVYCHCTNINQNIC